MKTIKVVAAGLVTILAAISGILNFLDAAPQYEPVFWVLIGVAAGFWLNKFIPDGEKYEVQPMDARQKLLTLTIMLLILPPALLSGFIVIMNSMDVVLADILSAILGWGVALMILAYIIGATMIYDVYKGSD